MHLQEAQRWQLAGATRAIRGPMEARARHVARASTGWKQEDPVKHRARLAARASTGLLQDKSLKHRARTVPRTRTRLLRAVLEPPAHAIQATRAMPAQEHAQRA